MLLMMIVMMICRCALELGVSGRDERVAAQIELQRRVFASGVPSFGSCWALQVAVVAAGGACRASPHGREQGVGRKNRLTPEGAAHPPRVAGPARGGLER